MLFDSFRHIYCMKQKNTKRSSRLSWPPAFVQALQYASFRRLPITSLTVTFVESRYPQKLLGHLRLDVIVRANTKTVEEVMQMSDVPLEIAQIFEETGWAARWEARGRTEGRTEGALAIAQNMVNLGLPLETVVSATQLKPEQVQTMYRNS